MFWVFKKISFLYPLKWEIKVLTDSFADNGILRRNNENKRSQLVEYLEHLSGKAIEEYQSIIKEFMKNGIYGLYKEEISICWSCC